MPYDWGEEPVTGQSNPRHAASLAVPFFQVANMEESLRFYTGELGFVMTNHWSPEGKIRWCWIELDKVALMLQQHPVDRGERGAVGVGVTICIFCADAIAIYRDLTSRGVAAARPFVGNGLWVTSVTDPDGYRIDFESPTKEPEETEFVG